MVWLASSPVWSLTKCSRQPDEVLRVAILLPNNSAQDDPHDLAHYNSLQSVLPAVELAASEAWNDQALTLNVASLAHILPGWRMEVMSGNTNCSSTDGPLQAFEFHCQAGLAYDSPFCC